ncbi:MAG: hypothetical protein IPH20_18530 [Bacteroidales bacterium]|nr:hypothetical protein [Bacteroidales bacterium]
MISDYKEKVGQCELLFLLFNISEFFLFLNFLAPLDTGQIAQEEGIDEVFIVDNNSVFINFFKTAISG